jgi:hypothetical protein
MPSKGRASPVHHAAREWARVKAGKRTHPQAPSRLVEPKLRPASAKAGELRKAFAYAAHPAPGGTACTSTPYFPSTRASPRMPSCV